MAAKRKSSKKSSLKNMSQTHGKTKEFEPTTLDQIWGDDGTGMYGTLDVTSY